jgi:hypothetical protein
VTNSDNDSANPDEPNKQYTNSRENPGFGSATMNSVEQTERRIGLTSGNQIRGNRGFNFDKSTVCGGTTNLLLFMDSPDSCLGILRSSKAGML